MTGILLSLNVEVMKPMRKDLLDSSEMIDDCPLSPSIVGELLGNNDERRRVA